MSISYAQSNSVFSKHVVKLVIASFVEEKDFIIPMNAVGVPLSFPNPWNPSSTWTASQKAQNYPLNDGQITYRITVFNNLPNFGVWNINSNTQRYNIGRLFLLTGLIDIAEPLILYHQHLNYNNGFVDSGTNFIFDPQAYSYVVTGVKVSLNAVASGTIAFRKTIAL